MANPNSEIWGAPSTWIYSLRQSGLETTTAKLGHFDKPKTAYFGTGATSGFEGSLVRAINVSQKLVANEFLDESICPCGQDSAVSPWGKIAIFNKSHNGSTVPEIQDFTDKNINWFFADKPTSVPLFQRQLIRTHTNFIYNEQYAPKATVPINANNNIPVNLCPYVSWGLKSLILSIEVGITTNGTNPILGSLSWVTLDDWKNNYSTTHYMTGLRFFVRGCTAINSTTLALTYNNDGALPSGNGCSGLICPMNKITVKNGGEEIPTQFLYFMGFQSTTRRAHIFTPTGQIINDSSNTNAPTLAVLPCWNYFQNQTIEVYHPYSTDYYYYYKIPYSDDTYNKIMAIAALFGCFFTPTNKYVFDYDMLDNDLYLPIIDENGVAHGQYTRGAENANNPLYTKNSIRDIDYDPDAPPTPIDPNTYSDTTNWNNVDFRQAFTKRYLLTGSQVAQLSAELWAAQSSKPADIDYNNFAIDEYLTNNPIDTIVSLKYFPCTFADVAPAVVHLGKYTTNIAATALGTSVRIIDFAPIECFPHFNDFRDYEPFTELAMYIPFCGTVKIPTAECMGNYVSVKLAIDTSTGAATGYVIVSKTGSGGICVATCQGMSAIDIPVSGLQSANLANAVFNATANWTQTQVNNISANSGLFKNTGGVMGAIARGMSNSVNLSDVKGGILGGPIGAAGSLVNSLNPISALQRGLNIDIDNAKADYELSHIQVPTRLVGSASPALGCVIELDCRLIIYRPVTDETALSNYADTVGYATVQGGTVGQFSGFTVGTVDVSGINATAKEKQAIAAAFANGVYL